jgi:hypothetical protein
VAFALAAALMLGSAMAWSPGYCSSWIAIGSVCLVGVFWAMADRGMECTSLLAVVGIVAAWGPAQLITDATIAPWLTMRATMLWTTGGIAFLLTSSIGRRDRPIFLNCLLWGGVVLAVFALLMGPTTRGGFGTFLSKNHFAALMELIAPIALWRSRTQPWFLVLFAVLFAAVTASASRAGVLLLLAEFFIGLALTLSRRQLRLAALSAVLLAGAAFIAGPERIIAHFQQKSPWSVRGHLLASTIRMASDRPWFGSGLGTWRIAYPGFATFDTGLLANEAHDDWAEWGAEGGVPFAILIAALTISLTANAVRSVWGLGVVMVMVHSLVDYPLREPAIALAWFALAGAVSASYRSNPGLPLS